ncbi:MAG: ATP-binding cassette domain-containing protein [Chloroflexi bacterium]|nr:ATP-binding cassette domain-containing protein [Chloroflexota bacterium]
MDSQALKLKDVTYWYPGTEKCALEKINLEIKTGEFVGIVGANGAGRSTLCYCMNGLVPHSLGGKMEGEIIVHGIDTAKSTTAEIAQWVGLVFSDPEAQLTQLLVADEVAFGPANLGLPREKIAQLVQENLKLVQLDGLEERNTHSLSGGQQQRLAIASVLAMNPDILILDEPTSNLDPRGTYEVFSIVTKLNRENHTTVVMVEYQVDLLAEFADRILVLDHGNIILDGPPGEVFSQVDKLSAVGVQVPQVTKLFRQLDHEAVVHVDQATTPVTVEKGSTELAKVLKKTVDARLS